MLYKGIVMEIHQKYCIVLTNNQEFVKLKNKKNTSVSQDIYFTDSDIYSQNSYSRWVFAAAIIMFGVFLSGIQIQQFYPIYSQNAAVISIDINPSIEFYVDENMKVNKVIPLNKDSYGLLSENWVGQSFHTVVNEYLDKAIENGYLKQESTILMSCASLNNNFDKNVIKKEVNDAVQEKNISDVTYGYIESNKENVKRAKKSNVSIGKYEVYLHIKDTHQDINTIEKIKKAKVSELVKQSKKVKVNKNSTIRNQDEKVPHNKESKDGLSYKEKERNKNRTQNIKKIQPENQPENISKELVIQKINENNNNQNKLQQQNLKDNDDNENINKNSDNNSNRNKYNQSMEPNIQEINNDKKTNSSTLPKKINKKSRK